MSLSGIAFVNPESVVRMKLVETHHFEIAGDLGTD